MVIRRRSTSGIDAKLEAALAVVGGRHAPLGQRRVQVDHMGHDRGAEDAGGQQDALGSREARDEAGGHRAGVGADAQRVVEEAEQDHPGIPAITTSKCR